MDPRTYLTLASELAACAPVEYKRSAINRAYYAAYGVAHQALDLLECEIPQTATGHQLVRDILTGSSDPSLKTAGGLLNQLYACRIKADYRYSHPHPEEPRTCIDCVRFAANIIARIDTAMKDVAAAKMAVQWAFASCVILPLAHIGRLRMLAEAAAIIAPLLVLGRELGVR